MIQRCTRFGNCKLVQSFRAGSSSSPSSSSKIGDYHRFASQASSSLQQVLEPSTYSDDENPGVDWDNLGFYMMRTDYMYMTKCTKGECFEQGQLSRYGNIELSPAAGVLNYGQGLFEGTKAYRSEDGRLLLFRPEQNAIRMKMGAERMCMPSPSIDQFVDAVKQTAIANKRWIPPAGKGSLYLRPLLMGSGQILGLGAAPEYIFLIYVSPVGNYFKEGFAPLNLYVEEEFDRASRGGTGGVKSVTNYAPGLKPLTRAKSRGFSDVLYLDSVNKKFIEEVSSCNIFILKGNVIASPAANGTILEGVTRKSIIDIARENGYQVEERVITIDELIDADEVFCTGTAVGVAPVGSVTYKGQRIEFKTGPHTVSQELYTTLEGIKRGLIKDNKGWIVEID
ncbi:branched-chain amino acid aminotransferase 1, mitochondrial-like isoform X2 [Juglans regia]|uniref:branched-chain-amino-acid transaminase n=1 Tax=Juglans regia TaxID=51240 RepID=A0A6P9EWC3_JUGRE|nr:branched-chain amino acid aminotransferase 1, mitochondrial-like isoform X2 [Juglans regia]